MNRCRQITASALLWAAFVRLAVLALVLVLVLGTASRVCGSEFAGEYLCDVWTSDDGLPDSSVTAITQTPDGYLWIGTYNGLARFDGVRFVTFDPANTPELLHARVRGLFVDQQGTLWINTYEGSLTTLRHGVFTLQRRNARLSEAEWTMVSSTADQVIFLTSRGSVYRKMLTGTTGSEWQDLTPSSRGLGALGCEDGAGAVWLVDNSSALWRLAGGRFERAPEALGLAGQTISCLVKDYQGRLWAGSDRGISVWNGTKFQTATPANAAAPVKVTSLFVMPDDTLWAVANGQLRQAAHGQWAPEAAWIKDILPGDLSQLKGQAGRQGGLWFFNYGRGLLRVGADGRPQEITGKEGFPREHLNCLFEDREGNCWAGMDAGGLIRVRERRFRVVDPGKNAKSVCQDEHGVVWIGTLGGGLGRWQSGLSTNFGSPDGAALPSVYSVCADAAGRLWASASDEDLFVATNGGFSRVSPIVHGVKAILADALGRVWAGTRNGLYYADRESGGTFHFFNGLTRHYVRALAEDGKGTLWAGTGNGELYCVSNSKATLFQPADNQESGAIWSLLAEPGGTVWVGMFRGGLLRFRDGTFTRYGKKDGLPDNVISQILDDGHGRLWLGSHKGVFSAAKSALNAVARGEITSVPTTVFGRSDGLPSLECSGGYQPAAWRGQDGWLWFTTVKGAVSVKPEDIRPNLLPPPVVIEEILVDGKSLETNANAPGKVLPAGIVYDRDKASLVAPPGKHQFEFRYTGLSLVSSDRVQFKYRLEGADAAWVEAGTRRSAQYNLLPAGDYRFIVKACNSDRIWNETGATLSLKILPHVYESLWFRALAGLVAAGLVAGAARFAATRRLRRKMEELARQQAVERERARIAKDIHDDLGASLTLIAVLGDLAKQEKGVERIEKMAGTAREAVKSLDEIVWAVNPRNDTLAQLIDYTGQFAANYLRAAGVRCLLDVPEQAPLREVPSNVRHNVFLVVKEALQNVIKHARATEVWLRIHAGAGGLRMVVEDNGCGFERAPEDALADGLRNMRQRMNELGGQFQIQSRPGAGTQIIIELPWPAR
jgi:signal transduction histidine kinase/ligand-binding sensor domain-containing protein